MSFVSIIWRRNILSFVSILIIGIIISSLKSYSQITLDSATVTPTVVNVTGGATATADYWLRSPGDSISFVFGYFGHPDSSSSIAGFGMLVQGTKVLGKWEASFYLSPSTPVGVYPVYVQAYNSFFVATIINTGKTIQITGGDTQPPTLAGTPTINPTSLDLTNGAQLDTVIIPIQDDFSGVLWVSAKFKDHLNHEVASNLALRISGDSMNGVWKSVVSIPQNTNGSLHLIIDAMDYALNNTSISTGVYLQVSGGDTLSPVFTGPATISPTNVNPTTGPKNVTVTVNVKDDRTKVFYVDLSLIDSSGSTIDSRSANLISGDSLNGNWQAVLTIPQPTAVGAESLFIHARDRAGNYLDANTHQTLQVNRDPESMVTFQVDLRRLYRLGLLSGVYQRVFVEVFDGVNQGVYFLDDGNGDSIWTGQSAFKVGQTIHYAFALEMGDRIYELGGNPGVRVLSIPSTTPIVIPVVQFDNLPVEAVDMAYAAVVNAEFSSGSHYPYIFNNDTIRTFVTASITSLDHPSIIAIRRYAKSPGGTAPPGIVNVASGIYWAFAITPAAVHYSTRLTFEYNLFGGITDPTTLRLLRRTESGQPWIVLPTEISIDQQTLSVNVVDTLGEWTLGSTSSANTLVPQMPGVVSNPIPSDGELQVVHNREFTWSPATAARNYDFYLWKSVDTMPAIPTASNLTQPRYKPWPSMLYNTTYKWKVVAKNIIGSTSGPTWTFTTENVADLIVSSVELPATGYSGKVMDVKWIVKNIGNSGTNPANWYDVVYISLDSVFNIRRATRLAVVGNVNYLGPGESYVSQATVKLPEGIFGQYYMMVTTNANNTVAESRDTNNTFVKSLNVILTPPPDLQITAMQVPDNVFSGQTITINYTEKNLGNNPTNTARWYDAIYISSDSIFNQPHDTLLATFEHLGVLLPDSGYQETASVKLPNGISGTYYLFVYADYYNNVYEYTLEGNNVRRAQTNVTLAPPPDLIVSAVSGPSTGNSGTKIPVDWTVKNQGPGVALGYWHDRVSVCKVLPFNPDSAFFIGNFSHSGSLEVDSTYSEHQEVTLPNGISGQYYLFVETDWKNEVYEATFENNNISHTAIPVQIALSPWPDLVVTSISKPDSATANDVVTFNLIIKNQGSGSIIGGSWIDSIFISSSTTWNPVAAIALGGLSRTGDLLSDSSYSVSFQSKLPIRLITGAYYVYVNTNARRTLFEYTDTLNNISRSGSLLIHGYPQVDLSVVSISAPDTASSGQPMTVNYTVQNIGSGKTPVSSWTDVIYLSSDTILNAYNDFQLARVLRSEPLTPAMSYNRNLQVNIPNGISGNYYVIVMSDSANEVNDTNRTNNVRYKSPPISIKLSPSPDLQIVSATIPSSAQSGQPVTVRWTVQNKGIAPVSGIKWYDAVYISNSSVVDINSIKLGYLEKTGPLAVNESYSDSLEVQITPSISGIKYLIVQTDSRDDIYEYGAENNNTYSSLINVELPPPADLIVTNVSVPGTAIAGDDVTITWTLKNQGVNPAIGRMSEAVYFSSDTSWSIDDPIVGIVTRDINLAPGASTIMQIKADLSKIIFADSTGEITGATPGLMLGTYSAIVRTNIKNNIRETDLTNNNKSSTNTVNVDVHMLALGVFTPDSVMPQQQKFYRVVVPAGVDLRIRGTSGGNPLTLNMYIAYNRIPTPSNYDYMTVDPLQNLEIFVPSTFAGSYYILIRSQSDPATENYNLLAQALSFSISSINPYVGGMGGSVTTHLLGAGFRDSTRIFLTQGGVNIVEGKVRKIISTMELVVRWDLRNVQLGTYDILARNPGGITTTLSNGFIVEPARELTVGLGKNIPRRLLVQRRERFSFEFLNTSNIDIPYFFAFIAVPPNTETQVTTSGGLIRRSQVIPDSLIPNGIRPEDYLDLGTARYIPLFARDIAPGEALNCMLVARNMGLLEGSTLPMFIGMRSMDRSAFLDLQLTNIEGLRTRVISTPTGVPTEILAKAYDPKEFAKYVLDVYKMLNLIDRDDTLFGPQMSYTDLKSQLKQYQLKVSYVGDPAKKQNTLSGNKSCEEFFNMVGCAASIGDCFIPIPIPPIINYVSCAIGVSGCFGVDTGLLGCFGILSAITCLAKEIICNHLYASLDPNDIIGPEGYGDKKWIAINQTLPFRIRFENDPKKATAPAQRVVITQQFDTTVDIRTFRLGSFGFANQTFDIPGNPSFYSGRLDLRDSMGIYVDVIAGIDVLSGKAFWNFKSIDPATGELPNDAMVGLLPVDDSTGRGNGYVNYTIRPKQTAQTGDSVHSSARVVFDQNDPLDTKMIFNIIDAHHPQSSVSSLPSTSTIASFPVHWNGVDDSSGSSLKSFSVYVSRNDSAYFAWLTNVTDTMAIFNGTAGSHYKFFCIGTDYAGNVEPMKMVPDASIQILTDVKNDKLPIPSEYALKQNYPNPFNPQTRFKYQLPAQSKVTLKIYDVLGRIVGVLVDKIQEAGYEEVLWDAHTVASGVYFYRLEATSVTDPSKSFMQVKKMILLK